METKLRAFQLATDGSLFSFYKPGRYTLIEARLPKGGIEVLKKDIEFHQKLQIDVLHITSWDNDHCNYDDLIQILNNFRPALIEIPDYEPDSDNGKLCKRVIQGYDNIHQRYIYNVRVVSFEYINSLPNATRGSIKDIVYRSKQNTEKKNDMSLIRLFRSAGFNVLSLGDCECASIAANIANCHIATNEVDVLILPHHGADNGFISKDFLLKIKPKIAVCTSNYDNQYEHPKQAIRDMLYECGIPLYTTKTGDIIIAHKASEFESTLYNLMSDNQKISSQITIIPKRFE